MRALSILAPAFAAIPLLLACTRTDAPRASADSPIRSAAPVSDTSAASRPSAPADSWTVTPAGIGAIRVGLDTTDLRRIGGEFTVPKASAECSYVRPALAPRGVLVMLAHGRVARVDVDSAGVRSDAGIAVGDNLAAISTEVRYPLTSPLNAGRFGVKGFVDWGTTWNAGTTFADAGWRRGIGGGIFFGGGPVLLDLAAAWAQDGSARVNFGLGVSF